MKNPIFYADGRGDLERGWYHYEEDYHTTHGPFRTRKEAASSLEDYCRFELGDERW